jgi:TolB-like protein/DNA-binding winged helix-turn-helix (wHTH) protein/Flp pilus assembly protein TadD
MSADPGSVVFTFSGFSLDPRQRLLFGADGQSRPLSGRAFDTLLYLVEHPNELIDKRALMGAVWPDVVVEENNLNQNISLVRRALGDTPGEHRFVVTIPGRGFRFVPSVTRGNALTMPSPPAPSQPRSEAVPAQTAPVIDPSRPQPRRAARAVAALCAMLAALLGYFVIDEHWISKRPSSEAQRSAGVPRAGAIGSASTPTPTRFNPPAYSIAVLPFINMSGDKEQEYFSDGLTEEVLNSLAQISELQVAARTSTFSFKEKDDDIGTIARKLNVAMILQGSVRRSAHTVRITAQLINSVTGFHVWSKTYDRNPDDVLKLQTEIATAVADALKVTLLGDLSEKIELGGTHNSAAFDAYLRGSRALQSAGGLDLTAAIAMLTQAIQLDPHYALALASRSTALAFHASEGATGAAIREDFDKALADAQQAIILAPELAQAHMARATVAYLTLDFARAREEYERARELAPRNSEILRLSAQFAADMGQTDVAIATARRALVLDPLGRSSHSSLARGLYAARRFSESAAAHAEVISLNPDFVVAYAERGFALYGLGDLQSARASCESKPDNWVSQQCLAIVYDKLGRRADAEAELAKMKSAYADSLAFEYAGVYAQWGDRARALDWLDKAVRLRESGLTSMKTDPLVDPLRHEPRFQAAMRELKFPG